MTTPPGNTHLIVKDCWVDHNDRSDLFIHNLLKERNNAHLTGQNGGKEVEPPGIAIYLAGDVDNVSEGNDADENTSLFEPYALEEVCMRKMTHKRFVFETCGVTLQWFATIKEFVYSVLGAVEGTYIHHGLSWTRTNGVQGHKNAFELHILHSDVSAPNVMIRVKGTHKEFAVPGKLYL